MLKCVSIEIKSMHSYKTTRVAVQLLLYLLQLKDGLTCVCVCQ